MNVNETSRLCKTMLVAAALLSAPLAYTAIGVWCVTAVVGAFAAHRGFRAWRGRKQP